MTAERLLLHTCCAPCFSSVHEVLSADYSVSALYYNPNIAPFPEYMRRMTELITYSNKLSFNLLIENRDTRGWTLAVKKYRALGERSDRCAACIRYRLERTFRIAVEREFPVVCTTLSVSPHKDPDMINRIGRELEARHRVGFLAADFKKQGGFARSVELSRREGFYRQAYCGCGYSRAERIKKSARVEQGIKKV
jgi:epoxyqueuosine reductase